MAGAVACALALATGCGSQTPTAAPPTPAPAPAPAPAGATAEARAQLERALQPLEPQDGADRAISLVVVIADAVAPDDKCLTSVASGAAAAAVRAACPADAGRDVSLAQLVLDHAGKVLATAYAGADTGALEKLLAALPIGMPLPAKSSACELPAVAGVAATGGVGRTYVVLGADGKLHAGRMPMATVRPGGVDVSVDRGAPFPGAVISSFDPQQGEVFDATAVAPAVARLRGGAAEAPAVDGTMKKKEPSAKGQYEIESAGTQPLAEAPVLMLVDRHLSAFAAALLAQQLLWSELAVSGPSGIAAALPVHLRVAPPGDRELQPVIALTSGNVLVGLAHPTKVAKLARVPDGSAPPAGLADALTAARAKAPAGAEVLLLVDGNPSVVELAQILAAVNGTGVGAVTIETGVLKNAPERRPKARISAVKVKGRLAPAAVDKALAHHRDDLLACFAELEDAKPGTLSVSFIVAPTGRSAGAHIKGGDPALAACVAEVTDGLRFKRPRGAASVSYRVEFSLAAE